MGAACGGVAVVESSEDTGTGGATSSATNATVSTTASNATSSSSGGGAGGGCPTPASQIDVDPPADGPCGGFYMATYVCFPRPAAPTTCEDVYSKTCVLETYACGLQSVGDEACGPDPAAPGECCYVVVGDCPVGRPFLVEGQARVAAPAARDDWASPVAPDVSGLDSATREALAGYWQREALAEHASVASFARFILQLLSVGAPAELLTASQRALADEIEHARLGFALATAYGGSPLGPAALSVSDALEGQDGLATMALAVAREGCIAETVSALQIAAARDGASDAALKQALSVVAEQELAHALLAWKTLAWCLERGDASLRQAVREVFATAHLYVGLGTVPAESGDPNRLREHGCLPMAERRSLARHALREVVLPAATALLASHESAPRAKPDARPSHLDVEHTRLES